MTNIQETARLLLAGEPVPRPGTPDHLRSFVKDLYDQQCLRCRFNRALVVAHLENWPTIRERVRTGQAVALGAYWEFHQPANMVLLCCNCHALFDDPKETDVDLGFLTERRDTARRNHQFPCRVRRFVCQELGRTNWVDISGLGPLLHWLEDAAADGLLTEPHRFMVPTKIGLPIPIDVTGEEVPPDADLSRWPTWDAAAWCSHQPPCGPG